MERPVVEESLARNVRRLSRLELPGAGQVRIVGQRAFVGHLPNRDRLGTTILDVSDPRAPRVISQVFLDDDESHSHKVRVVGDLMFVNYERNMTPIGRKADELPGARAALLQALGREPTHAELAARIGVSESDIPAVEEANRRGYPHGGFRIYDLSDVTRPRPLVHQHTGGIGVHRFDVDERHAYISTEMEGYVGNILVIYALDDPLRPREVSRWWLPGQHAAAGEAKPWPGRRHRLHHALRFGDQLWAGCWHGGVRVIDVSDITRPTTVGAYNYHPPFPEPTHTFMPVPGLHDGRRIAVAIDEEDHAHSDAEVARRRGRPHGCLWVFDVTDLADIRPLSIFEVSELDSPWSRATPGRFGAHQFQEHMDGTLLYCAWFSGGLRIVDVADPHAPREVGHFIPHPAQGRAAPQTNDVDVDARGLVYIVDRYAGFDILEFTPGR